MRSTLAGIGPNRTAGAGLERTIRWAVPTWRQWRAWADTEPALAGASDIEKLVGELRHGEAARQDELLAALVRVAQHGIHPDTALLVLARCLWPGLSRRIRRYSTLLGAEDAASIAVAGLVEAVAGYDPVTERRFVASRLLALPTRQLWRAASVARDVDGHRHPVEVDAQAPDNRPGGPELSAFGLVRLAVDASVLGRRDAWLIYATRTGGLTLAQAAHTLSLNYNTAWKRRHRAEQRWADWWMLGRPVIRDGSAA
jgi:hypothetical protein